MSDYELYNRWVLQMEVSSDRTAYVPSLGLVLVSGGENCGRLGDAVVLAHARGLPMSEDLLRRMRAFKGASRE